MRSTRVAVIAHHVEMALRHSTLTMETYAADVADLYESRTPAHARRVAFHPAADGPYAAMRANAQIVRRMIDGGPSTAPAVRMPVEVEEAVVLALPEPFRAECHRELAARMGLLAAAMPATDPAAAMRAPAQLLHETAQAIEALAPMLMDGQINSDDAPLAGKLIAELDDVIAACLSIKARAIAITCNPNT